MAKLTPIPVYAKTPAEVEEEAIRVVRGKGLSVSDEWRYGPSSPTRLVALVTGTTVAR